MLIESWDVGLLEKAVNKGEDIVVIDVRESWELQQCSLDFAHHLPLSEVSKERLENFSQSSWAFLCAAGVRSLKAGELAKELFPEQRVINIEGGIKAWKASGLPCTSRE